MMQMTRIQFSIYKAVDEACAAGLVPSHRIIEEILKKRQPDIMRRFESSTLRRETRRLAELGFLKRGDELGLGEGFMVPHWSGGISDPVKQKTLSEVY